MVPSEFEAAVFGWIASDTADSALRTQLDKVQIEGREYTVVGCYSQLVLPKDVPIIRESYGSRGPLDGPSFESPVVEHGGGTLLWFKNGRADSLEIFAFGEYFPEDHAALSPFKLSNGP